MVFFACCVCKRDFLTRTELYKHILKYHKTANIRIRCLICKKYNSPSRRNCRQHYLRKHNGVSISFAENVEFSLPNVRLAEENVRVEENLDEDEEMTDMCEEEAQSQVDSRVGKLLLDLEAQYLLNSTGVSYLVEGIIDIVKLANDVGVRNISLTELKTEARRRSFYTKQYFLVKPRPVFLGYTAKKVKGEVKGKRVKSYGIPLLETLKTLMRLPEYRKYCTTYGENEDGYYDGSFLTPPGSEFFIISLAVSIDDIEILNVLGQAKKIHKLTVCLFEVLNVPAELRSGNQTKHLLFLCLSKYIKSVDGSLGRVFKDLIDTVNESKVTPLQLDDSDSRFILDIKFIPADTLASNYYITGTNESPSFAIKPCRSCNISRDDVPKLFDESEVEMRNQEQHMQHVNQLAQLSSKEALAYQKSTGVKRRSPIVCDLVGGDILIAPHDPFHVMLEGGVLAVHFQLFLHQIIKIDKLVSLKQLNAALKYWNFFEDEERNRPPCEITDVHLDYTRKLNLKGLSLFLLCQEIPFILMDRIEPDNKYLTNFLRCLQIANLCLWAPICNDKSIAELRFEIEQHHRAVTILYENFRVTPKFHFAVHFSEQIRRFSSLRYQSTLRYESHYSIFKLAKLKNFVNVPFSLAFFHQKYMSKKFVDDQGKPNANYFNSKPVFEGVSKFDLERVPILFEDSAINYPFDKFCTKFSIGSLNYKRGTILEISDPCKSHPVFGEIAMIGLCQEEIYLFMHVYDKSEYAANVNAYELNLVFDVNIIELSKLKCRMICPVRVLKGIKYVIRRHAGRLQPLDLLL